MVFVRLSSVIILSTTCLLAVIDAVAKWFVLAHANAFHTSSTIFSLTIYKNPGIAFSIPLAYQWVLPVTGVLCVTLLIVTLLPRFSSETRLCAGIALIGAIGNLLDRIINGFTTDYLMFFRTSVINISDILIVIGIAGLIWYDGKRDHVQ